MKKKKSMLYYKMNTQTIFMCVVALLIGMLVANMLQNVCGCSKVEGFFGNNNGDKPDMSVRAVVGKFIVDNQDGENACGGKYNNWRTKIGTASVIDDLKELCNNQQNDFNTKIQFNEYLQNQYVQEDSGQVCETSITVPEGGSFDSSFNDACIAADLITE